MVSLFIISTKEATSCAEQIRTDLEAKGYQILRELSPLSVSSMLQSHTIEQSIMRSAAIILLWETHAAQSGIVDTHIQLAQRLHKTVIPVLLDETPLPTTLVTVTPIPLTGSIVRSQPCSTAVTMLMPQLPAPDSTDPLLVIAEQMADIQIRVRRQGIQRADELLKQGREHEGVVALLDYLARRDQTKMLQNEAQDVLNRDAKQMTPPEDFRDPRYFFGARCRNGHVSWFDKRKVCNAGSIVYRGAQASANVKLTELSLPCQQLACGLSVTVFIDCEGF